ncbi:MAG: PA4642 family protein, partial [Pseudomonadales bacterium]|nr:PA4642 family protein [Pseudomonadales bacterium]
SCRALSSSYKKAPHIMAGPSQPQVTDEVWDDDRVKSFLSQEPSSTETADFYVLLRAYRGMRPDDFKRFLSFFVAADRDLDATDNQGRTLWQIIESHRHGHEFIALREKARA